MSRKEKPVHAPIPRENAVEHAGQDPLVSGELHLPVQTLDEGDTRIGQSAPVAGTASLHRLQVRIGRNYGDPAESVLGQATDQRIAAALVIDQHAMRIELREAAVEHDERKRLVDQTTDLLAGTDGRRYDQPVDLLGAEQADHPVLPLGLRLGTANHQRIAVLFHFHLDLARHLRVKRIGNRRQDQADHARLARIQAAGQQVRAIVESLGAARNPLLRGGADPLFVRAARQHPRNRRLRQIQRLGYVLERSPHTFGTT